MAPEEHEVGHVLEVDLGPDVLAGFTAARDTPPPGGAPRYLNLAPGHGDDDVEVAAARTALAAWAGAPVAFARQVHGAHVHRVTEPPAAVLAPVAEADALVTSTSEVAVAVLVADCVPVLLADPDRGVVAAVHAGRAGVVAGVVGAAVAALGAAGARPGSVRAAIGPAVCGSCYEVSSTVQCEVLTEVPEAVARTTWGTPSLDLPHAVTTQLAAAGVRDVVRVGGCTLEDPRWFSHRGSAAGRRPGRMAGVVRARGAGRTGVSGVS